MSQSSSLPAIVRMHIYSGALVAGAAGVPGAFYGPGADVPVLVFIWARKTRQIASALGIKLSKEDALKLGTVVASGISLFLAGSKGGAQLFAWSGVGTIPAVAANGGLNGVVTFMYLKATAEVFSSTDVMDNLENLGKSILRSLLGMLGIDGMVGQGGNDPSA